MSSNKRLCLSKDQSIGDQLSDDHSIEDQSTEDNYRRDSFSDRVCDDLCANILKYLPLKYKLKLQYVCKQFKRVVLESHKSEFLQIPQYVNKTLLTNEQHIELFKKWPRIGRVCISRYVQDTVDLPFQDRISNELIEAIIKYCNNLTHIKICKTIVINSEVQKKLFDKFADKLIFLQIKCRNIGLTFTSAQNIEELSVKSFDSQLNQIKFYRLKKFEVKLFSDELDDFEIFIENNEKTLKHLWITSEEIYDKESAEKLLKIIAKSTNLVNLGIAGEKIYSDESLAHYWQQIAINCKQIKSLRISFYSKVNLRINDSMLSILKLFNGLKRLEIFFKRIHRPNEKPYQVIQDLKGLQGLTHLCICAKPNSFKETILIDIDINLPELKSLTIYGWFTPTIKTAQYLCKLSSLETIKCGIRNKKIIPEIERHLIQNCKHFKNFMNF